MHASTSLTPAERNYSQTEKKALAKVFAIKRFHKMLYGRYFTLTTDNKSLLIIFRTKESIPVYTANSLLRRTITLLDDNFTIKYKRIHSICLSGALSGLMTIQNNLPDDSVIVAVFLEPDITWVFRSTVRALPVTLIMVCEATPFDVVPQKVMRFYRTKWPNVFTNKII